MTEHTFRDYFSDHSAESRYVAENYRTIPFPLKELTAPPLSMETTWFREELEGYLESWSAAQNYMKQIKKNPLELIRNDLDKLWRDPSERKQIRWPLNFRIGRV